jgi:hypothetical protein
MVTLIAKAVTSARTSPFMTLMVPIGTGRRRDRVRLVKIASWAECGPEVG